MLRSPSENWGQVLITMIAFGTAALLFLVTEELLTEAHEVKESPLMTSAFFYRFFGGVPAGTVELITRPC